MTHNFSLSMPQTEDAVSVPETYSHNTHQRVLVSGGAGFIGSHVVDALIDQGYRVFILDDMSTGQMENLNPKARFYPCDITNFKKTDRLFAKIHPTIVFHIAAQISVRASVIDPVRDAEINVLASLNLIRLAHKYGAHKFIFSSTGGAIYGNARIIPTPEHATPHPLSPYAIGKLTVERYLRFYHDTYRLNTTILRYANVYGPRQNAQGEAGVIALFIERFLQGHSPTINGDGEQTRDYVYVADVVAANIKALESRSSVGIYNIGTGEATSVNSIFDRLNRQFNGQFTAEKAPPKKGETRHSALDTSLALRKLYWKSSVPLAEGLSATVLWYKAKAREKVPLV